MARMEKNYLNSGGGMRMVLIAIHANCYTAFIGVLDYLFTWPCICVLILSLLRLVPVYYLM